MMENELLEILAEKVHNIWCTWTKKLIASGEISEARQKRWHKECYMPYKDLTEEMKDLDRAIVKDLSKSIEEYEANKKRRLNESITGTS